MYSITMMQSQTFLMTTEPPALERSRKGAALVDAFLAGRNERTIQAYRQDLEDFRMFLRVETLDEAARVLLSGGHGEANGLALAYKASLLERKLQPATINRRLAAIRSLVKLANTLGMVSWSLEVKNLKTIPYRDTRGPGRSGFVRLLEEAGKRKNTKAVRDRALIRLLHDLGLSRGEVVYLNLEDVDLAAGTMAILGKGRSQKELLSLPEPTKVALAAWLEVRGGDPGPLFTNCDRAGKGHGRLTGTGLYSIVRKLGERVGIKCRPHGLRHTAITEACQVAQAHGMGLEEVLDFSRHASVTTLMVYRDRERNVQGRLASLVASE